jgi:hypothetical protein
MEPEVSLPYSQVAATCPYPEPTPSSPHDPSNFLNIHLNIILPSTSGSPQRPLSLRFPHELLIEYVRGKPELYDIRSNRYSDNVYKNKAWDEIGRKLNRKGNQLIL